MDRYEYTSLSVRKLTADQLSDALNELAGQGWRVVQLVPPTSDVMKVRVDDGHYAQVLLERTIAGP